MATYYNFSKIKSDYYFLEKSTVFRMIIILFSSDATNIYTLLATQRHKKQNTCRGGEVFIVSKAIGSTQKARLERTFKTVEE